MMPLTIRSSEADRLARELAAATGETLTEAATAALRERLERRRTTGPKTRQQRLAALQAMRAGFAGRQMVDPRSDDEILGYNDHGTSE